ncbi:GNAT family N-acetyltransferase [Solirubrobacter soli]|uniref:GNAT family N-acetyltransferase n=1 Tax=Solirubrobacter soli TaxID=363832 RepID=UPI000489736F|nr:GNAT family N-acetyltransferase [Solirubrobacter soli]
MGRDDIGVLEPGAAEDVGLVQRLSDLVNAVYTVAEDGMWQPGAQRTTPAELAGMIRDGQIAVATRDGAPTGMVRLRDVSADTAEFGMLVAAADERNTGIGRALLDFAERTSAERGMTTMQLELLVPRGWAHPSKEFLKGWYGRRGYRLIRTGKLDDAYPHLAPHLATPCDLEVHAKPL